mmetsp:Transcript_26123/g.46458  ORF Transcript_26123/g.46458 Transcript_26123/m.46458 type:complete len:179 (-) Transcript_26123:113-649(-)
MGNKQSREPLTVVAIMVAKPGKAEILRAELDRRVVLSRNEIGCSRYDLHVDTATPGKFLLYETWGSVEKWRKHMHTDHMKALIAESDKLMSSLELLQLSVAGTRPGGGLGKFVGTMISMVGLAAVAGFVLQKNPEMEKKLRKKIAKASRSCADKLDPLPAAPPSSPTPTSTPAPKVWR